ncbi:hypothetical protein [Heliophilum fasciatum]|uniref:Uncharacterized protein n=1 Tax=Heliophilum fasciatum TaxID=35700 RepID=A0A4V2SXZ5_9FIRM|nr:hypothetical protein [Heliophilum fasciatum]MCW2277250.1 hypothetical protein [Heliophilum fasciatum]TCP68116.1 hypothetical protein EDD73_10418 [Heliophilum fasciatum]
MFDQEIYVTFLWTVSGALLALLGSTGIFVSLLVQRRVERLQDVLEEFLELPYFENKNLTGPMANLVRKYQMYYLFPHGPSQTLLFYLDFTLALIGGIWMFVLLQGLQPPLGNQLVIQGLLLFLIAGNFLLFRRLLQHSINPTGNELFNAIIPPPDQLRSVSYLSRYVNVSVRSMIQQARLALVIQPDGELRLKEELSFDDFFYILSAPGLALWAWGELRLQFPADPITKKPVPLQRNIEIPLAGTSAPALSETISSLTITFWIFALGEKHPIQYRFILDREDGGFHSRPFPENTVQSQIVYQVEQKKLRILKGMELLTGMSAFLDDLWWDGERYYTQTPAKGVPCRCLRMPEIR